MSGSFDRNMMSSCCGGGGGGLVSCSIGMACTGDPIDCVGEFEMIGNGLELINELLWEWGNG